MEGIIGFDKNPSGDDIILASHILTYQCGLCGGKFKGVKVALNHRRDRHNITGTHLGCAASQGCHREFHTLGAWVQHAGRCKTSGPTVPQNNDRREPLQRRPVSPECVHGRQSDETAPRRRDKVSHVCGRVPLFTHELDPGWKGLGQSTSSEQTPDNTHEKRVQKYTMYEKSLP